MVTHAKAQRQVIEQSGSFFDMARHSCEGRNSENSLLSGMDARPRGHDEKNTPANQVINPPNPKSNDLLQLSKNKIQH